MTLRQSGNPSATRLALIASASLIGLMAATSALAQTPAPDAPIGKAAGAPATTGISEIIVTATRTA